MATPIIDMLASLAHEAKHDYRRDQGAQDARRYCKQEATLEQEAIEAVHCEVHYTLKKMVESYNRSLQIDVADIERRQAKELAELQARHAAERKLAEENHDREWLAEIKAEKLKDEYDATVRNVIVGAIEIESGDALWEWEQGEVNRRVAEELAQQEEQCREESEEERHELLQI